VSAIRRTAARFNRAGPIPELFGGRGDLTAANLLLSLFSLPLVTLKIVAVIPWKSLQL
jgi:DUF1365 family protein